MRYQCPGSVIAENLEDKTVLLNVLENTYFGLNQSAYWLWQRLCEGNTMEECIELGLQHFDIQDREVVRADFEESLTVMLEAKLLDRREQGA